MQHLSVSHWYSDTLKFWLWLWPDDWNNWNIYEYDSHHSGTWLVLCRVCVVVCTSFHHVIVFFMDSKEAIKLIMMCLLCLCCRAHLLLLVYKPLYSLICKITLLFFIRILSVMLLECGVTYYSFSGTLLLSLGTKARW